MDDAGGIIELRTADWEEQVLEALRDDQMRSTEPRRTIIRWIATQHCLFSIEALASAVAPLHVGRATAYRTVDWLRDHGWLSRIQTAHGNYTYARTLPGHHHHATCNRCGATLLIRGCSILDPLVELLHRHGFRVEDHILEVIGSCQRCQLARQIR